MALLSWKDALKSGHPSVDYEHENLISTINEMHDKMVGGDGSHDTIKHYLGEIHALIEAHFALEEKIMRDIDYAELAAHKADHDRLLEEIRDIMDQVEEEADFDYNSALAKKMSVWFALHFSTLDKDFHKAVS